MFFQEHKKLMLTPVLVIIVMAGGLFLMVEGAVLGPMNYKLF